MFLLIILKKNIRNQNCTYIWLLESLLPVFKSLFFLFRQKMENKNSRKKHLPITQKFITLKRATNLPKLNPHHTEKINKRDLNKHLLITLKPHHAKKTLKGLIFYYI